MADFRRMKPAENPLYDIHFDALLIEQSLAAQYGILPAAQGELPYSEWAKLVGGLLDNTPLGRVVAVRAECDRKVIAHMNPWAKRIRSEWASFRAKKQLRTSSPEQLRVEMAGLEQAIARLFGGDRHG